MEAAQETASPTALFTIRPVLPPRLALGLFLIVGFFMLFPALVVLFVAGLIAVLTGLISPAFCYLAGALVWVLGVGAIFAKFWSDLRNLRFDFYPNRLAAVCRGKQTETTYSQIGHISSRGGRLLLYKALEDAERFDRERASSTIRIDVRPEEGEDYFQGLLRTLRAADPGRLFSYDRDGELGYSVDRSRLEEGAHHTVQRLALARAGNGDWEVTFDDGDEPAFTVRNSRKPRGGGRVSPPPLVGNRILVARDPEAPPGEPPSGPVLLALATAPGLNNHTLSNGQAVRLGGFQLRGHWVGSQTIDLEVLGHKLTAPLGHMTGQSPLTLDGTPGATVTWEGGARRVEFDRPVNVLVGLALALVLGA